MIEVLSKGYLAYESELGYFVIGEIRKEVWADHNVYYIYDIRKESVDQLSKFGLNVKSPIIIDGIDLDYGYYQKHVRVPFFISMRTPDRNRMDIEEILERYELEFYDQFEILLRNRGNSLDQWRVLRNLDEFPILNKEDFS